MIPVQVNLENSSQLLVVDFPEEQQIPYYFSSTSPSIKILYNYKCVYRTYNATTFIPSTPSKILCWRRIQST